MTLGKRAKGELGPFVKGNQALQRLPDLMPLSTIARLLER